jgi:hypothetical protein
MSLQQRAEETHHRQPEMAWPMVNEQFVSANGVITTD